MRFLTLDLEEDTLGALVDGGVVRVRPAVEGRWRGDAPARLEELFHLGRERLHELWEMVVRAAERGEVVGELDEAAGVVRGRGGGIRVLAPLPAPRRNILCIGKNYRAHVNEVEATALGADVPEAPVVFTKATTAVNRPGGSVPAHRGVTAELDYEGEIAVVLARGGRGIPPEAAWGHVFGLTLLNDITARDLQRRHRQFFLGKSLDGSAPMGPVVVHRSALPPVEEITLTTRINGELRQEGRLSELIFGIPTLIAALSAGMTLLAGDIIATGTPAGVGAGLHPPRFLAPGHVVEVASPAIGRLVNTIADPGH